MDLERAVRHLPQEVSTRGVLVELSCECVTTNAGARRFHARWSTGRSTGGRGWVELTPSAPDELRIFVQLDPPQDKVFAGWWQRRLDSRAPDLERVVAMAIEVSARSDVLAGATS